MPGQGSKQIDHDMLKPLRRDQKTKGDFEGFFQIAKKATVLSVPESHFLIASCGWSFAARSQFQFTFIDLPGLIDTHTNSQSTRDVELVHSIVSGYLQNPRSIILAVVSATDHPTQGSRRRFTRSADASN